MCPFFWVKVTDTLSHLQKKDSIFLKNLYTMLQQHNMTRGDDNSLDLKVVIRMSGFGLTTYTNWNMTKPEICAEFSRDIRGYDREVILHMVPENYKFEKILEDTTKETEERSKKLQEISTSMAPEDREKEEKELNQSRSGRNYFQELYSFIYKASYPGEDQQALRTLHEQIPIMYLKPDSTVQIKKQTVFVSAQGKFLACQKPPKDKDNEEFITLNFNDLAAQKLNQIWYDWSIIENELRNVESLLSVNINNLSMGKANPNVKTEPQENLLSLVKKYLYM